MQPTWRTDVCMPSPRSDSTSSPSVSNLAAEWVCAHCPHLGAHLAEGGMVVGDSIKCPFHGWRFNADGKVVEIPYTRLPAVPERCKTPKYEAAEFLGMVFLWFDAEGRPPAWQLHVHEDLLPGGLHGRHRLVRSRSASFGMHVCEMVENSADAYHFQTLHAPLPVPMLEHVVGCTHTCTQRYPEPPCADADSPVTAAAGPKHVNTSCGESSPIDSDDGAAAVAIVASAPCVLHGAHV